MILYDDRVAKLSPRSRGLTAEKLAQSSVFFSVADTGEPGAGKERAQASKVECEFFIAGNPDPVYSALAAIFKAITMECKQVESPLISIKPHRLTARLHHIKNPVRSYLSRKSVG